MQRFFYSSEKEPLVTEVRSPSTTPPAAPAAAGAVKKLGLFSLIGISIVLTQV